MQVRVVEVDVRRPRYRYAGFVWVETEDGARRRLPLVGTVAQWLHVGETLHASFADPEAITFDNYTLARDIPLWPPFQREYMHERRSPLSQNVVYAYRILAREAQFERDYEAIVELEQYHYASDEAIIACWYCEACHRYEEANVRPRCAQCGQPMRFHDVKSATRASRFLVLELVERAAYEPRYVAYVRVDPPIPLMHRRLPDGAIERDIRQRVFPAAWFTHPFHPEVWAGEHALSWWEAQARALQEVRSPVSRLARVVVHPDYRVDGLGQLALQAMIDWLQERWVPEMRVAKAAVETVAMMARYNPFLEKAGFIYLWDTASGRPVLYYPLSEEAKARITHFLAEDPVAREHGGRLYRTRFTVEAPLSGPIVLRDVAKTYTNRLDLNALSPAMQEVLTAFGVRHRVVQKHVLRRVQATFAPGSINVIVGASGSGKTTLLRLIYGALTGQDDPLYRADEGEVEAPTNARVALLLPGEVEPDFGDAPIAEVLYRLTGSEHMAVELLNYAGISDAVLYRAPFRELSTGQKERARLAYLLALRPNVVLIDEFAAHLDLATARRVARRLGTLARQHGITLIVVLHRQEVIDALEPDAVYIVGYGTFFKVADWPERGFRVREPYATYIVEGKKRWEIRKHPTRVRGRVGVISGGRLVGTVEIQDVHGPYTVEELADHYDRHLAHPRFLREYAGGGKVYVWELAHPEAWVPPPPVPTKRGQQVWVTLREQKDQASTRQETTVSRETPFGEPHAQDL